MEIASHEAADLSTVRDPIDQILRPMGFRSRSRRFWDRRAGQILQVIHLDRSSYGPQNRLQVLFGFLDSVDPSKYKVSDFGVVLRFERIAKHRDTFAAALDQEKFGMQVAIRKKILQDEIVVSLVPLLNTVVDRDSVRTLRIKVPSQNDLFVSKSIQICLSAPNNQII